MGEKLILCNFPVYIYIPKGHPVMHAPSGAGGLCPLRYTNTSHIWDYGHFGKRSQRVSIRGTP